MIKWCLVIMLLGNILYFAWEMNQQHATEYAQAKLASTIQIPTTAKKLLFIAEDPSPTAAVSSRHARQDLLQDLPSLNANLFTTEQLINSGSCFTIGPFDTTQAIADIHNWFTGKQLTTYIREQNIQEKKLFWLYLTSRGSKSAATATMHELKKQGIAETRLIDTNELPNAISLGLYASQAEVNKRLVEVQTMGYEPVVLPFNNSKKYYWLDVRSPIEIEQAQQFFAPLKLAKSPSLIPCQHIAMRQ